MPGADAPPGTRRWILALRGGPAAKLRAAERHWKALWQRPTRPGPPEAWLAELGDLPEFPARQPWTAVMVRAVLGRMRPHKAPGLDGWTVAELRLIPDAIIELIAELLNAVEGGTPWPKELAAPEGLLLDKPGGDPTDPMAKRPIWLLPMVYRVWATRRAPLLAAWRAR